MRSACGWLFLSLGLLYAQGNSPQPFATFHGTLKRISEKSITLDMGEDRVLDFQRNGKTRFFKGGAEVKAAIFQPGDHVLVEGPMDPFGGMIAAKVTWELASTTNKDGVTDTWADEPQQKPPAETKPAPAAPPDPEDPGPPKLTRGKVADPTRERSAPLPANPVIVPAPISEAPIIPPAGTAPTGRAPAEEDTAAPANRGDDLIRRATAAIADFMESLPSYVCQETITRYRSITRPAKFDALDVVTANLVYENHLEDYRDIKVDGKAVNKKMTEIGGAWSTGEFATMLIAALAPQSGAEFEFRRDARIAGMDAKLYNFHVPQERSSWEIGFEGKTTYRPAYTGSLWIDPKTARVLRIETQSQNVPESFPVDHVEVATDYGFVRLGDAKQYLLPIHSETLSCQRGTDVCHKNVIDFRNYKKYSADTTITFGDPK